MAAERRHANTFIKRVIICGFRSYREEVMIDDFCPELNIVVGANGSGKSNFFQAIEFVLSDRFKEVSRHLRNSLIYEGCGPRALNASVEIVFDNFSRRFPLETNEVILKRTVGTKKDQYFLNYKQTSKQEVVSLLESAGFSRCNPYYIVKQGKINQLALWSDLERLQLLKQIAGASSFEESYKNSREELLRADAYLQQVEIRITELRDRLQQLEKESSELKNFLEEDKRKRLLERAIIMTKLDDVRIKLRKSSANFQDEMPSGLIKLNEKLSTITCIIQDLEAETSAERINYNKRLEELEELQTNHEELEKEKTKLVMRLNDLNKSDPSQIVELVKSLDKLNVDIDKGNEELEDLKQQHQAAYQVEDSILLEQFLQRRNYLFAKEGRNAFLTREKRDAWIEKELEKIQEKLITKQLEIANLQQEIWNDAEAKNNLGNLIQEHLGTREDLELTQQILQNKEKLKKCRKVIKGLKEERMERCRKITGLEIDLESLKIELRMKETILKAAIGKDTWNGKESILRLVEEFKSRTDDDAKIVNEGYCGLVIDSFRCNENIFIAMDVTGRRRMFYHIVKTSRVATILLTEMNRRGLLGLVTFMALDKISFPTRLPQIVQETSTPRPDSFPIASSIYPNNEVAKGVVDYFWGKTFLARSLEIALRLARNNKQEKLTFVTCQGDLAMSNGSMTGGYFDSKKSIFKLYRDHTDVKLRVAEKKSEIDFEQHHKTNLFERIGQLESEETILEFRITANERNLQQFRNKLIKFNFDFASLERIDQAKSTSMGSIIEEVKSLESKKEYLEHEKQLKILTELTPEERDEMDTLNQEINRLQLERIEGHARRTEIQSLIDKLQSKIKHNLNLKKKELEIKISDLANLDLEEEIEIIISNLETIRFKIRMTKDNIEALMALREKAEQESNLRQEKLDQALSNRAILKTEIVKHSAAYDKAVARKTKLLKQEMELNHDLAQLGTVPNLRSLQEILANMTLDQMYRELKMCRQRLKGLGHVNQKAIQQFQDYQTQQQKLEDRQIEIEKGRLLIFDMMNNLVEKKDSALTMTFKQVRDNFCNIFKRLVPEGSARLLLLRDNSENSLSDGTQNFESYNGLAVQVSFTSTAGTMCDLNQLSGGQKTLVALALILAIQVSDPAPFYLFDEIDQALDPTHRRNVAELLFERSRNSQFICTTFRPELLHRGTKFYRVAYINKVSQIRSVNKETALQWVNVDSPL